MKEARDARWAGSCLDLSSVAAGRFCLGSESSGVELGGQLFPEPGVNASSTCLSGYGPGFEPHHVLIQSRKMSR